MMKEKEKKEYFLPEAEFILYSKTVITGSRQEEWQDDGGYGSDTCNNANQWQEGE